MSPQSVTWTFCHKITQPYAIIYYVIMGEEKNNKNKSKKYLNTRGYNKHHRLNYQINGKKKDVVGYIITKYKFWI